MKYQSFKWTEFCPSLYERGEMVTVDDVPVTVDSGAGPTKESIRDLLLAAVNDKASGNGQYFDATASEGDEVSDLVLSDRQGIEFSVSVETVPTGAGVAAMSIPSGGATPRDSSIGPASWRISTSPSGRLTFRASSSASWYVCIPSN